MEIASRTVNAHTATDTRLHGNVLAVARTLWLILITAILIMYGVVLYESLFQPVTICEQNCDMTAADAASMQASGISPATGNLIQTLIWNVLMPFVFFAVGLVLVLRRSDDWLALVVSFSMIALGPYQLGGVNFTLGARPGWEIPTGIVETFNLLAFALLLYVFPNGRFVPRWTRWIIFGFTALMIVGNVADLVMTTLNQTPPPETGNRPEVLLLALIAFVWFGGIISQVYRYRYVSTPVERQQTKWIIFGFVGPILTLGLWFAFLAPPNPIAISFLAEVGVMLLMLVFALLFPLSIGLAMLRYRLWDIDILIRRTVTYAIVAALLAIAYFGSVIVLQQLFATISGQRSEGITVLSTLVIAALFVQVRSRVQNAIDHRFNRKKYDAAKVMSTFAATVRDETDLEKLTGSLVGVVNETMEPKSVSVWLRRG